MPLTAAHRTALLKRAITSLAAILAVTSIFAVKAAEWEKRAALEHVEQPLLAKASVISGS